MKFTHKSGSQPLAGFTIKRGIGVGGFGEVYFAISEAGKEVALKRIQRNLDIELRGVRQCLNLKHQNLISLYDIKYDDHGSGWVVMEYVSGESLADVLERSSSGLSREDLDFWFSGIAAGVEYLHDHGIVHRDLKPGNIFVDDGVVKIGDYGLSKFISCSRRSGQTESVGTFHYMAPEIGKGVYGKEIDIYALGVILYELLTGNVPFEGESSQEIIMKHLTSPPPVDLLPSEYRPVVEKALEKDPDRRFRTVSEMMAALPKLEESAPAAVHQDDVLVIDGADAPAATSSSNGVLHINDDAKASDPLFIGEEPEEMSFGPVRRNAQPSRAIPVATVVGPANNGRPPEPIAQAVRENTAQLGNWWRESNLSNPVKVVLLIGAICLLLFNVQWLLPVALVFLAVYLVYFGIRSVSLAMDSDADRTPAGAAYAQPARNSWQQRRLKHAEMIRAVLGQKTFADQTSELTGSMLLSAVICGILSFLAMAIGEESMAGVSAWSFFAWLAVSSVIGSWLVLAISKFWEASDGEQVRRRFGMLTAGLVIGGAAWGASQLLMVDLKDAFVAKTLPAEHLPGSMHAPDGTPLLPAYLAFFALLFLTLRWWKQADPLRGTRFSLIATGGVMLVGWLLSLFLQFPQPWGFLLAAVTSTAVQLSAPWLSPKDKALLREQYQHSA